MLEKALGAWLSDERTIINMNWSEREPGYKYSFCMRRSLKDYTLEDVIQILEDKYPKTKSDFICIPSQELGAWMIFVLIQAGP